MKQRHYVQAIQTRFFGPSNVRGSRIKAFASAGSVTIPYDHALNPADNHRAAAEALAAKYNWTENGAYYIGGCLANGDYCFVDAKFVG